MTFPVKNEMITTAIRYQSNRKTWQKGSAKEHMEWIQPIQTVLDDIEALNQDMNRLNPMLMVMAYPIILTDLETAEGTY